MDVISSILANVLDSMDMPGTELIHPLTIDELIVKERERADAYNRLDGHLSGLDCPLCHNKGDIMSVDDKGYASFRSCDCMVKRRSLARLRRSGLNQSLTLESWESPELWQQRALELAESYAADPKGWVYISGRPGTGKTHLCAGICRRLIDYGLDTSYVMWRDMAVRAKALVGDASAYAALVEPMKAVTVLYIDDFFKGGGAPTVGDVNLAFELINARYNRRKLITIISSERSIVNLLDIDEAVGSRIYERSKDFYLDWTQKANWRMRRAPD